MCSYDRTLSSARRADLVGQGSATEQFRPVSGRAMKDAARYLGVLGEQLALSWYMVRGYQLLEHNWRCREGELDLVLGEEGLYVFCEVKTRSSDNYGLAVEAVTPSKVIRWRRAAGRWLSMRTDIHPRRVRFDIASVMPGGVEIIEDVF
ncbi:MAG: YraN family protein [Actinobacteria bacterium]|nr:YraN family protein [Actinomycetota bacterium]MCL6095034.1 YraN family protein [Actinomycetota bacterium]